MKRSKSNGSYSHHDASFWAALVSGQTGSGQSIKSYCQAQGVSVSSFYRWQKILQRDAVVDHGFSPIQIQKAPFYEVVIELPGGVLLRFADLPPVDYLRRLSQCFNIDLP